MFQQQAEQELFETVKAFHACKQEDGQSVSTYALKIKAYLDQIERLGYPMHLVLGVNMILTSLSKDYDQFLQNYNMHDIGKTIPELHAMLKLTEKGIPKKTPAVLAIRQAQDPPPAKKEHPAKDTECHHCHKTRHWKKNSPLYLAELKKNKSSASATSGIFTIELFSFPKSNFWIYDTGCGTYICNTIQGLKGYQKLNKGALDLSARIPHAPERYGFYIDAEEHKLGDHVEPPNYRAALSDPKFEKWLEVMNAKMQSMKDNQVWSLVDLPPNCKTVGSKWLFKKKTDMDGNIHTYKARLVAKGFTQTYEVDYEETFSPVADIKAIRILIAIAVYYDYEIWQMDVKTAFLNGRLNEDVYMVKPEGMDTSKRGTIPMQPNIDLSNTQGPSTPAEVKRMKGIPYASAVGSIMYAIRNTKDMFLVYGGDFTSELSVTCYTNASWETDRDDLRSQMGFVFVMNGGTVDWKSFKQSTTTTSSMKAEYIAAVEAAMEPTWIRKFIFGLGVIPSIDKPMDMYCDNICAITIADKPGVQKGAKHFR
uniref:Reverse transcriptase Ty1/copia-type domain-containing protein n=1 Tax=Tanacetum cinerariifolium TaxID=118510 RepID=A0A6L2LUV2_TANCI|nr:hypothetical protein [Tanacetum cinerariifolium]